MSELHGDVNGQEVRLSTVEKSVSNIEQTMSGKISEVEETVTTIKDSIANIKEQIKSEVEQFMKIQPKQISEQTVPMIKTEKTTEKVTLPAAGSVHILSLIHI